ncbi:unnamed protein product [Mytilus coruscus]|uniref:Apple domain-containing protein n=1 Tax=Mytilus coruscus TaxID=42192 RepID=A0A6J8E1M9_MYTCO|nr:unnamed protein product [Mytilus coruscus]
MRKHFSVPSFWIQHVVQADIEKSTFPNDHIQSKDNECVYAVIKYDQFQLPEIEFFTGSCNSAKYSFICMRQTNKVSPVRIALTGEAYFLRCVYIMFDMPLIEYSGKSYSVDECMDECFRLMNNGYACVAFEHSLGNSTCRFLERNSKRNVTKYYLTPDWDHYMLTNTKPIIGGSIVYEDKVLATSGGNSESYINESTASSISGSSILHVDDFLTTSGESTEILNHNSTTLSKILNHKSTTSSKILNHKSTASRKGITFWSIVLAIGAVSSFSGIFLTIQRILKTPQTHDRSFKEDALVYMENCVCVDVANPEEWTGMEYSKAHNIPPESFIGIITMFINENAKVAQKVINVNDIDFFFRKRVHDDNEVYGNLDKDKARQRKNQKDNKNKEQQSKINNELSKSNKSSLKFLKSKSVKISMKSTFIKKKQNISVNSNDKMEENMENIIEDSNENSSEIKENLHENNESATTEKQSETFCPHKVAVELDIWKPFTHPIRNNNTSTK